MWASVTKLFSRLRKQPRRVLLSADDFGITIDRPGRKAPIIIHWQDIEEIQTYKRDLGIVDDIRLALLTHDHLYEVSESDEGFMAVTRALERQFPTIPALWYLEVMQPPFAINQRTLWSRAESAPAT